MPKKPKVRVSFTYASCTLLVNQPMTCPLCQASVEPNVTHHCSSATAQPVKVLQRLARKVSR